VTRHHRRAGRFTFVGDSTMLAATVRAGVATCVLGRFPVRAGSGAADGPAVLVLRPEQVTVATASADATSDSVQEPTASATATVVSRTFLGFDTMVEVALADGSRLTARQRSEQVRCTPGDKVTVSLAGEAVAFPAADESRSQG
jgi:iron(III) transport system ATP-binding protein